MLTVTLARLHTGTGPVYATHNEDLPIQNLPPKRHTGERPWIQLKRCLTYILRGACLSEQGQVLTTHNA